MSKIDLVTQLVQNSALDILALSETKIDSSISDSEIEIQNYSVMRRDRARKGGGVCLFVSNSLKPRRRTDLEVVSDRSQFESVWIQVEFCQNRSSLVCCCYRPPHGNVNDFISQFTAVMEAALDFSDDIIIIGDINLDLLSDSNTVTNLKDATGMLEVQNLVSQPTRLSSTFATLLDVILSSKPQLYSKSLCTDSDVISDYNLVTAIRLCDGSRKTPDLKFTEI